MFYKLLQNDYDHLDIGNTNLFSIEYLKEVVWRNIYGSLSEAIKQKVPVKRIKREIEEIFDQTHGYCEISNKYPYFISIICY